MDRGWGSFDQNPDGAYRRFISQMDGFNEEVKGIYVDGSSIVDV